MRLADTFIQSDLQCIQAIILFIMCVPRKSNPKPFALQTQCHTTEPQEQHCVYETFVMDVLDHFSCGMLQYVLMTAML